MMLTAEEILFLLAPGPVLAQVQAAKQEWGFTDLADEDFFALVLLAPTVGMALANGSISLYEELALNKKARQLSKGNYFLRKDPFMGGLSRFVQEFARFEAGCYALINQAVAAQLPGGPPPSPHLMTAPYFLVKLLALLFLREEESILASRGISRTEMVKLREIGDALGLGNSAVFEAFCATFVGA
ncbi:MAG: hypothetical protein MUC97_00255 [Bernardetiaceae bacterium]|jgi:hypothetical protein|nr:hypothetical protein [Bernardetiaceae bacterium]